MPLGTATCELPWPVAVNGANVPYSEFAHATAGSTVGVGLGVDEPLGLDEPLGVVVGDAVGVGEFDVDGDGVGVTVGVAVEDPDGEFVG